MSLSSFSRAAIAVGLLISTVSAKFDNNSNRNVAVYWGQGSDQIPLSQVCADPGIDIVNIGFVNVFPKTRGDYPGTNHANACQADYYPDPKTGQPSKLLRTCPGVEQSIKDCQAAGKKVMLSIGGGYPVNYTLPTADVASYFADFLIGAYGPVTTAWNGKPRPFGTAVVDGFDLDLEAEEWATGAADLLYKNYDVFAKRVKARSNMLLSAAPQCVVPDARVAPALKAVPFDFIFAQFYNTYDCSAAKEYKDLKAGATIKTTTFTFQAWLNWLATESANKNAKLYLGLPAGPDGLPTHKDHYLNPTQADYLINQYKNSANFGGVMLWEASVSVRNIELCQSFGYWAKTSLEGTFIKKHTQAACAISYSAVVSSSTKVSSSKIASSTLATSTKTSSSSKMSSSTTVSSSTVASSTKLSSSSKVSSSAYVTSSTKASSSMPISSSTKVSSSVYIPSSTEGSSSIYVPSSSKVSSVHVPTSSVVASSVDVPSGSASSSDFVSSTVKRSSIYPTASTASSVFESSAVDEAASSPVHVPLPTESSSNAYPSGSASVAYPDSYPTDVTSSKVYPSASSTPYLSEYQSQSESTTEAASSTSYLSEHPIYSESIPDAASSTSCSSSSQAYPIKSSSVAYPYPAESSKFYPEYAPSSSGKDYDSVPSVTKGPEEYPSYPTGSTTTVVTTTYIDVCPTGLTTVTTVITKTVCGECAHPTKEAEYPEGWTTSVYVDETITTTLTKPVSTPTEVPAYPTAVATVYPVAYPAVPKPSAPINKEEYPSVPEKPTLATSTKIAEYPVSSKAPQYPAQPVVPEYPKKPVEDVTSTVVSTLIQHVTLSKVAVPTAYVPAPYPTAPAPAPYAPVGTASGTGAYAPLPTGTGQPTKPTSYTLPEFEGAASRFAVGMTAIVAVVAGFLVL